jgi:nucleoside-diphosphate-sugar epimerase
MTSLQSVREGLTRPFETTGKPPRVIYHTAAIIRFWERLPYCWSASYKVNVSGTENLITVAKELPNAVFVYTSTADIAIPSPKFLRLGWGPSYRKLSSISDSDGPPTHFHASCYARSKLMAEQIVKGADGQDNLRTGIVRPG